MKNKLGIIHLLPLILIGVLVIGGIGAAYYFGKNSNTPIISKPSTEPEEVMDETSDWEAYSDNIVTFRYPNNWSLHDSNKITPNDSNSRWPGIVFYPIENQDNVSIPQYEIEASKEGISPHIYTYSEKTAYEYKVGGYVGYRLQDIGCEPLACDKVSIALDEKIYIVTIIYNAIDEISLKTEQEKYRPVFDQILSTFEFVEE